MEQIIEIANIAISFDLINDSFFDNFSKYNSNSVPSYFVRSFISDFDIPNNKIYESEYYDLYEGNIQIQKMNGKIIGKICYKKNHINIYLKNNDPANEYLMTQYALAYIIEGANMIFMHGSSIVYRDYAFIFTAPSGTGKSTHTSLWIKYGNAKHINDDKNIIAQEDDELVIYPNPWSGKHKRDNNIKAPLKAIIFLEQAECNEVFIPSSKDIIKRLLPQLLIPKMEHRDNWEKVFDKLIELPMYVLKCNMERNAFEVIKDRIEGDIYGANR